MKKLYYLLFCCIGYFSFGQQYFFEDFSQGEIPPTWTVIQTNPHRTWQISLEQPDGHYEAVHSATANDGPVDEWLITPSFSLANSTKPYLELNTNFPNYETEAGYAMYEIKVSTDNGVNWEDAWTSDNYYYWLDWGTQRADIDLSTYKNKTNVKIAFRVLGISPEYSGSVWVGKVTVKEDTRVVPTSVTIATENNAPTEIMVDDNLQLIASVLPQNANQKIKWEVLTGQDLGYITSKGKLYVYFPGKITVKASAIEFPSVNAQIEVTVKPKPIDPCSPEYNGLIAYFLGINKITDQLVANDISTLPNANLKIEGIQLAVNYEYEQLWSFPLFDVNIHKDNNNQPGEIIRSFSDLSAYKVSGDNFIQEAMINFPEAVELQGAEGNSVKYWISVTTESNGYPIQWAAYAMSDNNTSPAMSSNDQGTTWISRTSDTDEPIENNFKLISSCATLGTIDQTLQATKIYPNPVEDILYIDSKEPIRTIQIVDLQGRTIYAIPNHAKTFNLTQLPNGVYLMKIEYKNLTSSTHKIIKK